MYRVLALEKNARILMTAPSNHACDLMCSRLLKRCKESAVCTGKKPATWMFRMNAAMRNPKEVPEDVFQCSLYRNQSMMIPESDFFETVKVVVATCMCSSYLYSKGVPQGFFTHILVDEAGQCTEPETLIPLQLHSSTTKTIIVGDPQQLGPILRSKLATGAGLGTSLLERCIQTQAAIAAADEKFFEMTTLIRNYRSHPEILRCYSDLFYASKLLPCAKNTKTYLSWSRLNNPACPMVFIHREGEDRRDPDSPSW